MGLDFILTSNSEYIFRFLSGNLFFNYIDCIGLSFPLITLFILRKQIEFLQKNMVILFYVIFFSLSIVATFSRSIFNISNLVFYNLIPILLLVPMHFFFKSHLASLFWKRFLNTISFLFFIYFLISSNEISSLLNSYYYLIFSFYIMFGSFIYLLEELNFINSRSTKLKIEFWFIVCLFFYATNCLLVWSLYDWLAFTLNDSNNVSIVWSSLHNSALFIHCIIFSIALIWNRHRI
jgi:hypothetical protein